jgi:hypothetical protein
MTRESQKSYPLVDSRDAPGAPVPWEVDKVLGEVARVDLRVTEFEARLLKLEQNQSLAPVSMKLPNGILIRGSLWGVAIVAVAAVAIAVAKYWR